MEGRVFMRKQTQIGGLGWVVKGMACGAALMALSLAGPALAQRKTKGGGTSSGNTAVTSTLNESASYQIQDDGSGAYKNGTDNVSSILQTSSSCGSGCGDWVLDTGNSTTRSISVTLDADPTLSSGVQAPFDGPTLLPTRIIVNCSQNFLGGFLAFLPSDLNRCPMALNFHYNGNDYKLAMGYSGTSQQLQTNPVYVSCTAVNPSTGKCDAWTVAPSGTLSDGITPNNIAELTVYQGKGRTAGWVILGYFDVNFSFQVTNP
jgi:hypothetical protein